MVQLQPWSLPVSVSASMSKAVTTVFDMLAFSWVRPSLRDNARLARLACNSARYVVE